MPTILSHAVVAVAAGQMVRHRRMPRSFWELSILCAVLPDFDVIGFAFDIPYESLCGHRGLMHSLLFAAVVAWLASRYLIREMGRVGVSGAELAARSGADRDAEAVRSAPPSRLQGLWLFLYFFAVTASHGLLDAMTDGGLGIAFFSPFSNERYFFPWQPIAVSPIGGAFFSREGLAVLRCEAVWIWLPCAVVVGVAIGLRRMLGRAK